MRIFQARTSLEDHRPTIDVTLPQNARIDWRLLDEVLRGQRPEGSGLRIQLYAGFPNPEAWDHYAIPGTFGLFSERLLGAVPERALRLFQPLQVRLNLWPYFFLKPIRRPVCLDLQRAAVTRFTHPPHTLKDVQTYAFLPGSLEDPLVFCPSEITTLLMTESVVEALQAARCKGLRYDPVPQARNGRST